MICTEEISQEKEEMDDYDEYILQNQCITDHQKLPISTISLMTMITSHKPGPVEGNQHQLA